MSSPLPSWSQRLLCDPQTSGGLLVACALEAAETVVACFHQAGFNEATMIGCLETGAPQVLVV
ncbi:MAG: hypothetical protein IPK09_10985 [Candidatus Competibacteraceae bacterium]|nr:hypothetical protein [Candidatus Competibacteraceae bacterium]